MTSKIPSTKSETFHVYPDVSVTVSEPKYVEHKNRVSLTIEIDYTAYDDDNDFTGYFELRLFDVEDHGKPKILYFDTMTTIWDDRLNFSDGPYGYYDLDDNATNTCEEDS
jgi:hypothetical protein